MTWPKKTYLPTYVLHTYSPTYLPCDTRQSCRLVTIETLITILIIENLNSWQSLLPDNQEWQWTAFAILAMFVLKLLLFVIDWKEAVFKVTLQTDLHFSTFFIFSSMLAFLALAIGRESRRCGVVLQTDVHTRSQGRCSHSELTADLGDTHTIHQRWKRRRYDYEIAVKKV